jgi:hypothetical protein
VSLATTVEDGTRQRTLMANDEEWVEDVKRWVLAGDRSRDTGMTGDAADEIALGYEAAEPSLLARHWPDAPTTDR